MTGEGSDPTRTGSDREGAGGTLSLDGLTDRMTRLHDSAA